jgi:flavin reductase (DIM6/NTAB) family NADH-FMN oxidoreductase RutF
MLAVNIGSRNGQLKDTARNMMETKEFVVNVATLDNIHAMHQTSAEYPSDLSEAEQLGIELIPGTQVKVPRIKISPIQMECRLDQVIPLGKGLNTLYIGEVLAFHLDSSIYDGSYVDSVKLKPIARLGGPFYAELGTIHQLDVLQQPPK